MENNIQNNTLSEDNKEYITQDNEEHLDQIEPQDSIIHQAYDSHLSDNEELNIPKPQALYSLHTMPCRLSDVGCQKHTNCERCGLNPIIICTDIKYRAVVFILLCGGNIVELDEFIYKTSDEFMGNYMIDELEFIPVSSGGFMDQEIGHDRYAETFYAVLKNSSIIANLDELDLDNFTISDLISRKIIKMISFTIYP